MLQSHHPVSYFVMMDGDQSVAHRDTLEEARRVGQQLADAEPIPCTFTIQTDDGSHVEDIERTDGATLADLIVRFRTSPSSCPRSD